MEIAEALWAAAPENVEIKVNFARSLRAVDRLDEAERLVNEVLEVVPKHPGAIQLKPS